MPNTTEMRSGNPKTTRGGGSHLWIKTPTSCWHIFTLILHRTRVAVHHPSPALGREAGGDLRYEAYYCSQRAGQLLCCRLLPPAPQGHCGNGKSNGPRRIPKPRFYRRSRTEVAGGPTSTILLAPIRTLDLKGSSSSPCVGVFSLRVSGLLFW